MEYQPNQIKEGITLHLIPNDRFKTNLMAIFITTTLTRENVTKNALIPAVLRRGSKHMPTQEEISKVLEEMYGATFDCGVDKRGDNQVLKFYFESINDRFLPQEQETLLKTSVDKFLELVFDPLTEKDNQFKPEYVNQEKDNLKKIIEGKIDNKAKYAMDRCIEEMYKDEPFGLYRYGYLEDLESIDAANLYEAYQQLLAKSKIDIFVSGIEEPKLQEWITQNPKVQELSARKPQFVAITGKPKEAPVPEKVVQESMEVTQGKLIIGLDLAIEDSNLRYDATIYNSILGGSANSKLFQKVREEASLAYSASSSYVKNKNNIFISCGIDIPNYEQTVDIIKKQLEAMKQGNFTDEEVENAKQGILSAIKSIEDEQDTEMMYYFAQELTDQKYSLEEYSRKISEVTKQKVIDIAQKVTVDTIYFLKD